jgi:hypothetical protein
MLRCEIFFHPVLESECLKPMAFMAVIRGSALLYVRGHVRSGSMSGGSKTMGIWKSLAVHYHATSAGYLAWSVMNYNLFNMFNLVNGSMICLLVIGSSVHDSVGVLIIVVCVYTTAQVSRTGINIYYDGD